LSGGADAKRGANTVIRSNGEQITLQGRDEVTLEPGDQIVIATPGGGGFGGPQ
jgi:5-oxoprolinase (ATP-hydrolysing)